MTFNVRNGNSTYTSPFNNNVPTIISTNFNNSSSSAHAILGATVGGASGGDAFTSYDINGVTGWSCGIDNSDLDTFKISNSWSDVGTSNKLKIETNGTFTFYATNPTARFLATGGDVIQFYQNRDGASPYWYFNTSGAYGVFSDRRLKNNITSLKNDDCLNFIKNLNPVEFNWKKEYGKSDERICGFIAQETLDAAVTEGQKNIVTNWESYDENNPESPFLGFSDHRLLPSLVGALKKSLEKIEQLEVKIKLLEDELS